MDTPGKPREPGPPPEVDKDAPFGRDDGGNPIAPHGLRKDGLPRLSPAGRRPAEEKARVGETPAETEKPKPSTEVVPARSYAPAIAETLEVVWLGGTVVGQVGPEIPVVGRFLPDGDKLQAQAAVILTFKDNIAGALDICAQHNEQARRLAEKMSGGGAGWALNAAFMMLPVISTSLKVWGKEEPQADAEGNPLPTLAQELAEKNRTAFTDYMASLAKQAAEATAEATEQAHEAVNGHRTQA